MRWFLSAIVLTLLSCTHSNDKELVHTFEAEQALSRAVGAGLQGNARRAVELLEPLSRDGLSEKDWAYRDCMLERFGTPASSVQAELPSDTFAGRLVLLFRNYWHQALTHPDFREQAGERLSRQLRELLALPDTTPTGDIEQAVLERLQSEGVYGLLGQTGVLRELMIWRQEDRRAVDVKLPHGTYTTTVAFLDDFMISGWGQFATCETRGAGGWVADRILFAVVPLYDDLDSEEFRVTFLGHETQHFLDLDTYPGLESWELEYRAKLIELSMAVTTRERVLQKFIEDQGDDKASHHSFANREVLNDLVAELSLSDVGDLRSVSGEVMRSAAYALYQADSARR